MAIIYGSNAPDTLNGTSGNDDVFGWDVANAEDDVGPADDDDLLQGHGGADDLYGGAGDDRVKGGAGSDDLFGGAGVDTLEGGDGDDDFHGAVNDELFGGAGGDSFTLHGASAYGGAGDDFFYLFGNDLPVVADAGAGHDRLTIYGGTADGIFLDMSGPETTLNGMTLVDFESASAQGSDSADSMIGGDFYDSFTGFGGDDTLMGGGGDDRFGYSYGDGSDKIFGGSGIDLLEIYYYHAGEALNLNLLADSSAGDGLQVSGVEELNFYGGRFDDRVTGGDRADAIYGERGNNTLRGGGGNDFIYVRAGESLLNGGSGTDTIIGGKGNDILEGGGGIRDTLFGNDGDDHLTVGAESAGLFGGSGSDTLMGGKGDDTLLGGGGGVDLRYGGGSGVDLLYGGGGSDVFEFRTTPQADRWGKIMNFSSGNDVIFLASPAFSALPDGPLGAESFVEGTRALDDNDHVIYDQATGVIRYDPDGAGGTAAVIFARMTPGFDLSAADFLVG